MENGIQNQALLGLFYCGLTKNDIYMLYYASVIHTASRGSLFMAIRFIFGVTFKIGEGEDHLCMET